MTTIQFGNSSTKTQAPTAAPVTWAHNHNSTFVRSALVVLASGNTVNTAVTYGGQSMTMAVNFNNIKMFYKLNPLTGSNDITFTGLTNQSFVAYARSFDFVASESNFDNYDTAGPAVAPVAMTANGVGVSSLYLMAAFQFRATGASTSITNATAAFWSASVNVGGDNWTHGSFYYKLGSTDFTCNISSPYTNVTVRGAGLEMEASKQAIKAFEF